MPYITIPGLKGKVYVPGGRGGKKRHKCPDCDWCQMCSETRCRLCMKRKACGRGKVKH